MALERDESHKGKTERREMLVFQEERICRCMRKSSPRISINMLYYEVIKSNIFLSLVFQGTCVPPVPFFFLYRKFHFIAQYHKLSEMLTVDNCMRAFNLC